MLASSQELPPLPSTPSSSHTAPHHRLLYRGALSLPDSYLLLDGLSFVAETRSAVQGSPSVNLLSNSLALALESMRGRPSLHLVGTQRVEDVWLDGKTIVSVYVHPKSILSRIYFQNTLCLDTIISADNRTSTGVRVSLTEDNDTETSDFLIYGQLLPSSHPSSPSSSISPPLTLQLYAARILPTPPSPTPHTRKPRPDDPTPRKPSAYLKRKPSAALALGDGKKPKIGRGLEEDEQLKLAREVMLHGPRPKLSRDKSEVDVFKVPPLPSSLSQDVFGAVNSVSSNPKGKEKEKEGSSELEKANKTVIKQASVACLASHGISKREPEFNELYQAIYRGTTFALRNIMRTQAVNVRVVERLLEQHARMYVNSNINGEHHTALDTRK
ncbi:hypothetical protein BC629DRAFT_432315 [Irpex lacteus]|nr:hypothetical protein BC629DRAFT_432315 [Irpex lacteus]